MLVLAGCAPGLKIHDRPKGARYSGYDFVMIPPFTETVETGDESPTITS
jgi:hypothetical protein